MSDVFQYLATTSTSTSVKGLPVPGIELVPAELKGTITWLVAVSLLGTEFIGSWPVPVPASVSEVHQHLAQLQYHLQRPTNTLHSTCSTDRGPLLPGTVPVPLKEVHYYLAQYHYH